MLSPPGPPAFTRPNRVKLGVYGPPALVDKVEQYMLASGRTESTETRESRRRSLRRMAGLDFSLERFAQNAKVAKAEGDAFLALITRAWEEAEKVRVQRGLPKGRRKTSGRSNYVKVLHMLRDCFGYNPWKVRWLPGKRTRPNKDVLSLDELHAIIPVPAFKQRNEAVMRKRFLKELALATGRRPEELQSFEDTDFFPEQSAFRAMHGAKGNADKALAPVESVLFRHDRAFMTWMRKRPVAKSNPRALCVKTDSKGVVRVMSKAEIQKELREIGQLAGVRFNATRARHTRIAAWLAQGKRIYEVMRWINHSSIETLASYVEFVEQGMAAHLAKPTWFRENQTRETYLASRSKSKADAINPTET